MIKRERRWLKNEDEAGRSLGLYDGPHLFTWVRAPWGWMLIDIEPVEDDQ